MSDNKVQITVEFDVHGRPKIVDAQGQVRKLGNETDKTAKRMRRMESASARMERSMRTLGHAAIALAGTYGIARIAMSFLDAARTTENYQVRLRALLGSVEEGNRLFDEMRQYASNVPFEIENIMGSATALSGVVKGGVDDIVAWIPLIGDLAAAYGIPIEEATQQFIRMYSAGAASADMFREKGISAALGFQAGVSYSAEETRRKLWEEWTKSESLFRGSTQEMKKTWDGLMSMASDEWFQFRNRIMGAGLFDFLKSELKMVVDITKEWGEENNEFIAQQMAEHILDIADAGLALSSILIKMPVYWADLNFVINRSIDAALSVAKAYIWLETALWRFARAMNTVNPSHFLTPGIGETIDANIQTGERLMENLDAMKAAASEHGVELMARREKALRDAEKSQALINKLRENLRKPQAPTEDEPFKPTRAPSFTDPAADAAKKLALEKKLLKEINQARMGTYEYKRWELQQEVAELEKQYGKQAIITQYYEAKMAEIAKDEREKGGRAASDQAKKLAQERLKLQEELTNEINRLTMTETDYQLWALEQQVAKHRAKHGEMTVIAELEAAKRKEILEQQRRAEADFAAAVAELHGNHTVRAINDIQRQKQEFIKSGIDRVAAERWAQEAIAQARERAATDWQSGAKRALEDYAKNAGNAALQAEDFVVSGFRTMENAVQQFARTGKLEISGLVRSILADLALIGFRQGVTAPLAGWLGTLFNGGTAGPIHIGAGGTTAFGMHGGGNVGHDASFTRQVPNWLFHNAPRLHDGLRWDEWPVILQQGEEVKSRADVARGRIDDSETKSLLRGILAAVQNGMTVRNVNVYERPQDWAQSAEGQATIMNIVASNRNALPLN
jgi:lambda family phage tail tape measure protein